MGKENKENKTVDLSKNLAELSTIAEWFEKRDEIDVEEGLRKVKEAAELIKESKGRLKKIENEFEEIKKDIEKEIGDEEKGQKSDNGIDYPDEEIEDDKIPF